MEYDVGVSLASIGPRMMGSQLKPIEEEVYKRDTAAWAIPLDDGGHCSGVILLKTITLQKNHAEKVDAQACLAVTPHKKMAQAITDEVPSIITIAVDPLVLWPRYRL
mmetsp:Transcript_6981/g.16293  ORF Transcript_6981/g.16293 Transcript_6981/m.16293 type:complete len:107 (-) Transcript_6981:216-536(-)